MKSISDSNPEAGKSLAWRLDDVRMNDIDRVLAKQHLLHAEHTIDLLWQAAHLIRTTAAAWRLRLLPPADRQRDDYFAGAVDRVDLEQRIRNWERRPTPFWDGV